MVGSMSSLVIYVDVDDTLVRSFGSKRIPMDHVVSHVRELASDGATLFCWSSGGADYARRAAHELGIAESFAGFLPKPNVLIDDVEPSSWPRLLLRHPTSTRATTLRDYEDALTLPGVPRDERARQAHAFAQVARRFCAFLENPPGIDEDRPREAMRELSALVGAAVELPSCTEIDAGQAKPVGVGHPPVEVSEFDGYWEVFDPFEFDEPVVGSLSDDLGDIYIDIHTGLDCLDEGDPSAALWAWSFSYETHWGDHAVDAMRALHRIVTGRGRKISEPTKEES